MRRADHAAIFLLIAGAYTPFGMLALDGAAADAMLVTVWPGAAVGVLSSRGDAPRLTALIYVVLGWVAVAAAPAAASAVGTPRGDGRAAGLVYSAGAVVYARHRPDPSPPCSATTRCSTRW